MHKGCAQSRGGSVCAAGRAGSIGATNRHEGHGMLGGRVRTTCRARGEGEGT